MYIGCYDDDDKQRIIGGKKDEVGNGIPFVNSFDGAVEMIALQNMVCALALDVKRGHFVECVGADTRNAIWRVNKKDSAWSVQYDQSLRVPMTADGETARLDLGTLSWTPCGVGGGWFTLCVFDSATMGAIQCYVALHILIG